MVLWLLLLRLRPANKRPTPHNAFWYSGATNDDDDAGGGGDGQSERDWLCTLIVFHVENKCGGLLVFIRQRLCLANGQCGPLAHNSGISDGVG